MAKKKQSDKALLAELTKQFTDSDNDLTNVRDNGLTWTEREELLMGILTDQGSLKAKSQVNTGDLINMVFDGASRVLAQLPTGTIQALDKNDKGKNMMMNLIHEKYIMPNANAQCDFLTKLRMWDIYSRVFGSMPAMVDWRVDDSYVGPDLWLIHPRSFFPQAGAVSIDQMQYCQVSTFVSVEFLKTRDPKIWKNLDGEDGLIKKAEKGGQTKSMRDTNYIPYNETFSQINNETGNYAQVELRTRYERDRWVTYAPNYQLIVRDIPNPQNNHLLPIVMKHCFPLMDRLYALAEVERGYTLQYAANSLLNMYLDGILNSINPIYLVKTKGPVHSTIERKAGVINKWLVNDKDDITTLETGPQGLKTFTSTYGFVRGMMNNIGSTTDTVAVQPAGAPPGKSPAAIKKQASRENARDNWDRAMLEQALEEVNERMITMVANKQEKPIEVTLFQKDIEKIQEQFPDEDIMEVFESGTAGKIKIPASTWKGKGENGSKVVKFKYIIDSGSTKKSNEDAEFDALTDIIELVMKGLPGAAEQIMQTGKVRIGDKEFDFGYALKRYITTSGAQDGDKMIRDIKEDEQKLGPDGKPLPPGEIPPSADPNVQQLEQQMQQVSQVVQEIVKKISGGGQPPTPPGIQPPGQPGQAPMPPQAPQAPPQGIQPPQGQPQQPMQPNQIMPPR